MTDRIHLILKTKNISASKFADEIGVQRSSISHILSGRNNPSLELVQKIIKRFPDINTEWIISGKGSMYTGPDLFSTTSGEEKSVQKQAETQIMETSALKTEDNLSEIVEKTDDLEIFPEVVTEKKEKPVKTIKPEKEEKETETQKVISEMVNTPVSLMGKKNKNIERIVIFYSDKTFEEYKQL